MRRQPDARDLPERSAVLPAGGRYLRKREPHRRQLGLTRQKRGLAGPHFPVNPNLTKSAGLPPGSGLRVIPGFPSSPGLRAIPDLRMIPGFPSTPDLRMTPGLRAIPAFLSNPGFLPIPAFRTSPATKKGSQPSGHQMPRQPDPVLAGAVQTR
jgi:hypothetical protein